MMPWQREEASGVLGGCRAYMQKVRSENEVCEREGEVLKRSHEVEGGTTHSRRHGVPDVQSMRMVGPEEERQGGRGKGMSWKGRDENGELLQGERSRKMGKSPHFGSS
jgi:hypothetical protein